MGLHSSGNIELWGYTDVGTQICGLYSCENRTIRLYSCGNRAVELYRCGNTELWGYTDMGTQSCGAIQMWEHRPVGILSCGTVPLWELTPNPEMRIPEFLAAEKAHKAIQVQRRQSLAALNSWDMG